MGGMGKGKETKTEMWLTCSLYRSEYSNLKLTETTMGRGRDLAEMSQYALKYTYKWKQH
jgi:hypothetical protein